MIKAIKDLAAERGYVIYEQPGFLNIWGFRANTQVPNSFDDQIHVFTVSGTPKNRVWAYWIFKCTTDPGTFWLKNPEARQGTAILNPGQYVNSHAIGRHRGQYTALVQIAPLTVTRDYNRNNVLDFENGKTASGLYGINIHRASRIGDTFRVDKYSAGCQVFKNIKDFDFFIGLCQKHRKLYGNKFTYTLIDKQMESMNKIKQSNKPSKAVSNQFPVKPSTYAFFSPQAVADSIYSGIVTKNLDKVLKGLFQITDTEEYKKVNELIKAKQGSSKVVKGISTLLSKVFPQDPFRSKYRAQLFRIGLKWGAKGWLLSGTESEDETEQLTTKEDAIIWDKSGNCFRVPFGTYIGDLIQTQNGVTAFQSTDGRPYFIHTTSIKTS